MSYDYKQGKNRVETILDNYMEIEEKDRLPVGDSFTFENGYLSWVTAIFVDLRDSTTIFSKSDEATAKLIRAFTSEVIEILRNDENLREIGIRGDCVYAIYTTPNKNNIMECADKTFFINTFINMINKMLNQRSMQTIKAGIGMATDKELVIKTGRKGVAINSKVWIGKAVTLASKLSGLGDKNSLPRLAYSHSSFVNFIDLLQSRNSNKNTKTWFKEYYSTELQIKYHQANLIKTDFSNWIDEEI